VRKIPEINISRKEIEENWRKFLWRNFGSIFVCGIL